MSFSYGVLRSALLVLIPLCQFILSCHHEVANKKFVARAMKSVESPPHNCCHLCLLEKNCIAWSWDGKAGGTCSLHNTTAGGQVRYLGARSARVADGVCSEMMDSVEFLIPHKTLDGHDLVFKNQELSECCKICASTVECQAWTWRAFDSNGQGDCELKRVLPDVVVG